MPLSQASRCAAAGSGVASSERNAARSRSRHARNPAAFSASPPPVPAARRLTVIRAANRRSERNAVSQASANASIRATSGVPGVSRAAQIGAATTSHVSPSTAPSSASLSAKWW